jgi:DNA-binding MarR family transcriptional regulator
MPTTGRSEPVLAFRATTGRCPTPASAIRSAALQVRHHAAVGLVDRCERAGLVRRGPDPDDRRQVRVTLTQKGESILAGLSPRNRHELRALRKALKLPFLEADDS